MGTRPKWNRRQYLVNRKFQFSFIFYMLLLTTLMILILFASNIVFLNSCFDIGVRIGLPRNHMYFELIDSQRGTMRNIFLIGSFATFLCMTIFGVIFSHRIAGPLLRLKNYVEAMIAGKVDHELEFRKDDYFSELADVVSELAEKTHGRKSKKK